MDLKDHAAIVTGGASGLGWAAAEHLARAGARVTIFDLNSDSGATRSREIDGHFVAVNVADESAVNAAILDAESRHGKARILVNCAGVGPASKVIGRDGHACALASFSSVVTVNLVGAFNVLSRFAARIHDVDPVKGERGVIINTASIAAFDGQIGQAAYSASKGGIVAMTLPIARELARYGIRVVTIAPGLFHTPMFDALAVEVRDSLARQVPFPQRLGRPSEFAELVAAVIGNPMLNGEVIRLDGALRMAAR